MYCQPAQSPLSSVTFHNVIVFQCFILYLNTLFAKYTEVKYQLKQSFLHEYQICRTDDNCEIDNVIQKGEFHLTMSA